MIQKIGVIRKIDCINGAIFEKNTSYINETNTITTEISDKHLWLALHL